MNQLSDNELVSVIVPVYNVESFLRRCIDSILNQTYHNIEIILVDDGSTDGSYLICREYKEKNTNIVLIHKENGGLSSARNEGMRHIHGLYVMYVDSDDFLHKDCISKLLSMIKINNVLIAQCGFEKGSDNVFSKKSINSKEKIFSGSRMFETKNVNSTVWGKLYSRFVIEGIQFPLNKINEDEFYTYKVLYAAGKIAVTDKKMYYYYKNPNSIMRNKNKKVPLDIIDAFEERIAYFEYRKQEEIKRISIKEFCLRLVILFGRCKAADNTMQDLEYIKTLFDENYMQIKKESFLSNEERIVFLVFRYAPDWLGNLLIKLGKG